MAFSMDKNEQLVWNKKKKKYKDGDYLSWIQRTQACYVCGDSVFEIHHLKDKTERDRNDLRVIPLCTVHHRIGSPSPHATPARFRELYPMERLLQVSEMMLAEYKGIKCGNVDETI